MHPTTFKLQKMWKNRDINRTINTFWENTLLNRYKPNMRTSTMAFWVVIQCILIICGFLCAFIIVVGLEVNISQLKKRGEKGPKTLKYKRPQGK